MGINIQSTDGEVKESHLGSYDRLDSVLKPLVLTLSSGNASENSEPYEYRKNGLFSVLPVSIPVCPSIHQIPISSIFFLHMEYGHSFSDEDSRCFQQVFTSN